MKPELMIGLLLLLGGAQIVVGINILAGFGWSIIALGVLTLVFAFLIARGAANG